MTDLETTDAPPYQTTALIPKKRRRNVAHLVEVVCCCNDIEHCRMERYIADVRILVAELESQHRSP